MMGLEDGACMGGAGEEKCLVGEKPGGCATAGGYDGVWMLTLGWVAGLTMALVSRLP